MSEPSVRFTLDAIQLGAALALAGARPTDRSDLPRAEMPAEPLRLLKPSTVLSSDGRQLAERPAEMLRVAADPAQTLRCVVNVAGQQGWRETLVLCGPQPGQPFVALETVDDTFAFAWLGSAADASRLIGDMLGHTPFPVPPDPFAATLDADAYAALLAAADAAQATDLRTRLARTRAAKPVLTPSILDAQLTDGCAHDDPRWAVTAAQRIGPLALHTRVGRMADGMAALEAAGILAPAQRGMGFTPTGSSLVSGWASRIKTVSLTVLLPREGSRIPTARAVAVVCADALWLMQWENLSTDHPTVQLRRTGTSGLLELIPQLLEPVQPVLPHIAEPVASTPVASAPAQADEHCPSCQAVVNRGSRFCAGCGAQLRGKASAPPSAAAVERRCSNPQCGTLLPAGKKFCTVCGTRAPVET